MLKKSNLPLIFLIATMVSFVISSNEDASFGDILLHHVTNDQSKTTGEYLNLEIGSLNLSITKHVILISTK